jgi:hypothetical protein
MILEMLYNSKPVSTGISGRSHQHPRMCYIQVPGTWYYYTKIYRLTTKIFLTPSSLKINRLRHFSFPTAQLAHHISSSLSFNSFATQLFSLTWQQRSGISKAISTTSTNIHFQKNGCYSMSIDI